MSRRRQGDFTRPQLEILLTDLPRSQATAILATCLETAKDPLLDQAIPIRSIPHAQQPRANTAAETVVAQISGRLFLEALLVRLPKSHVAAIIAWAHCETCNQTAVDAGLKRLRRFADVNGTRRAALTAEIAEQTEPMVAAFRRHKLKVVVVTRHHGDQVDVTLRAGGEAGAAIARLTGDGWHFFPAAARVVATLTPGDRAHPMWGDGPTCRLCRSTGDNLPRHARDKRHQVQVNAAIEAAFADCRTWQSTEQKGRVAMHELEPFICEKE